MAAPDREVFALVGDGSYLMMAQEIVTAVSEGIKLIVVLVQNHGFASIGALSESLGSQRFGTRYRYRNAQTGMLDGAKLPVDLAANAESLGADGHPAPRRSPSSGGAKEARAADRTTVVHIETDPLAPVPSSESWWDVPVSEVVRPGQHPDRPAPTYEAQARPARVPRASASTPSGREVGMRTIEHWIGGKPAAGESTRRAAVYNPATGAAAGRGGAGRAGRRRRGGRGGEGGVRVLERRRR